MSWFLQLIVHLYSRLLYLYPPGFRDQFADEMTAVFISALSAAQQRGRPSWLLWCGREFTSLLASLIREQWLSLRQEEAVMDQIVSVSHADDGRAETPLEIIAGILPFILFGLLFTLEGLDYHLPSAWMRMDMYGVLVVHAILIIGLGIGWVLRFPRWSYAYLGVVVITSSWLAGVVTNGVRLFGYVFDHEQWGWRGWIPFLALTLVMLLFTRSLQPLLQLFQGIRRDWTKLSFALYAALTWLLMGITYDGKSGYNQTFYLPLNLFLLTLAITGGAFIYMRSQRLWPRVLALQAALVLYIPTSALISAVDSHSEFGSPSTAVGWLLYLLLWLMWMTVPLLPGLARHAWQHLRLI